jgi:hypothetical protein
MYYIYHIIGIKIGCTKNPKKRVTSQTNKKWEILETYTDINIASKREIELQKEYGYKVDKQPYSQTIAIRCNTKELYEINRSKGLEKVKNGQWNIISLKHVEKSSKPILCFDYKTKKFIAEFSSISEASRKLNLKSIGNISSTLNGRRNHTGGYTFQYKIVK